MVTETTDGGTVVVEAFGSMIGTVDWTGIGETIGGSVVMPALAPGLPASSPSKNETVTGKAVVDVEDFVVDDRFSGTLLVVGRFTAIVVVGTLPSLLVVEGVVALLFFFAVASAFNGIVVKATLFAVTLFAVTPFGAPTRTVRSGPTDPLFVTVPDAEPIPIARKPGKTIIAANMAIN